MSLADASLQDAPGQQLSVTMESGAGGQAARRLRPHVRRAAGAGRRRPSRCPRSRSRARLKATTAVERTNVESQNVAGILRGSDPRRRDEYVVVSAHLDHLGVGDAVNGDTIYNGAMDNASGVAAILEVATMLHESGAKPARSILFVAVTGEEKGAARIALFRRAPHGAARAASSPTSTPTCSCRCFR